MNFFIVGLDKKYLAKKFERFQNLYNCISIICSSYPLIDFSSSLSVIDRIDYTKLFSTKTVFESFQLSNRSELDKQFLESMNECYSVFVRTIDRCAAKPLPISHINEYYYELLLFFKCLFEKHNHLTHIFFPSTPHFAPDIVIFFMSKYYKINTIILARTDFDNKYIFRTDWRFPLTFQNKLVLNTIENNYLLENSNFIEYSKRVNKQSLKENNKEKGLFHYFNRLRIILNYSKHIYRNQSLFSPFFLNQNLSFFEILIIVTQKIINNRRSYDFYLNISVLPNLNSKYLYFALHFQPERSTQPEGSFFENQLLAIRMIEMNLPDDYIIYVKEHPRQFDSSIPDLRRVHSRSIEFYSQVTKFKRVKFVDINFNSDLLISKAKIVATITGSSGWQGLKIGKPVFIFGYPWYSSCHGTYVISDGNDIIRAINEIESSDDLRLYSEVRLFINRINPFLIDGYTGIADKNGNIPNLDLLSDSFSRQLNKFANSLV